MSDGAATERYRVVQWATGNIGNRAMGQVIDHPHLDLVGVYVYSPDKAGRDAGELCGTDPTGVISTRHIDDILALDADCVLYMPQACDMDEVCRLLAAGMNVVTTRGEFHHPDSLDPEVRAQVEDACRQGGTSIHSTGSSPGFISEAVPVVLTSILRRLDRLQIDEFADLSRRDSPTLLFELMGFGSDPASFDPVRWEYGAQSFGPTLRQLGGSLGLPLDSVEGTGEVATASRTIDIAAGRLEAGTVAAQRMVVTGRRGGEPLLVFRANWYCTTELDPPWELGDTGWRVRVDGDVPLDVDLRFDVPLERMGETSPNFTANRAVNAVAVVCAARPGIRTTADLPQVIAALGV